MNPKEFTVKQLLIAAALSRRIKKTHICHILDITFPYITKLEKDGAFLNLVSQFKALPPDTDHKEFRGLPTLFADAGRMLYGYSARIIDESEQDTWEAE